jgi:hypothetical protein
MEACDLPLVLETAQIIADGNLRDIELPGKRTDAAKALRV